MSRLGKLKKLVEGAEELAGASKAADNVLDMSKAARMQRAADMGFDTGKTYYHGTTENIEQFSPSLSETTKATFFTPSKNFANDHMYNKFPDTDQGNNVLPVYLGNKNTFDPDNPKHIKMIEEVINNDPLLQEQIFRDSYTRDTVLKDWKNRIKSPDVGWTISEHPAIDDAIRRAGFDSTHIYEGGKKNIAVFDPKNIRSVNAAFDPAKKDSANILAGLAGAGIVGAGLTNTEEAMAEPQLNKLKTLLASQTGAPQRSWMDKDHHPMRNKDEEEIDLYHHKALLNGLDYATDIDSRFQDLLESSSDYVRPNILGLPKHTDEEKAAIREQNEQLAEANSPLGFQLIEGKGAPVAAKAVSEAAEIAPTAFQKIRKLVEGAPKGVVQSADSAALARARAGMTKPGTISEAKVLRAPSKTPVSGANLPDELETGAEAMVKTPEEKEIVLKALKKRFGY